jgi:hypothetical protein
MLQNAWSNWARVAGRRARTTRASGRRGGRPTASPALHARTLRPVEAPSMRPISLRRFASESSSRLRIGRAMKAVILLRKYRKAWANARSFSIFVPSTAAGSSMPQCAVIGCPGHAGQVSPAASSQSVNAKSNCGATGVANSPQYSPQRHRHY